MIRKKCASERYRSDIDASDKRKIEKVAILGAGAVGSYVIWGLSGKAQIRLGVIAEGERAERLS